MAADLDEMFERLEWCRSECECIQREFDKFSESRPYSISELSNFALARPTKQIIVTATKQLPKGISIRIGTTTNEIRSILDALASALAVRNGKTANGVHFPIAKDENDFDTDARIKDKIRKISLADQAIIRSLKPWPQGNDLLCALHQLDVTRKHTRLAVLASVPSRLSIQNGRITGTMFPTGERDILKGAIIAHLTFDSSIVFDLDLGLAFSEPPFLAGKDAVTVLRSFIGEVDAALKIFN